MAIVDADGARGGGSGGPDGRRLRRRGGGRLDGYAKFFGSMDGTVLNKPMVGMAAS